MGRNSHPQRNTQAEMVECTMKLTGANGADPTINEGKAEIYSVSRTAEGVYRVRFKSKRLKGAVVKSYAFGADTPADVKGYTMTHDTYDTTTDTTYPIFDIYVWDSTFTAADIIAAQYLTVTFAWRETQYQGGNKD